MNNDQPVAAEGTVSGYKEQVHANYPHNYTYGVLQGLFFYAGMGLYNMGSIFPKLIFDLSHSNRIVGLLGAVMSISYGSSQLLGTVVLEHLQRKKPPMLRFGFFYRLPWFLMGLALFTMPPGTLLWMIIGLYAVTHFFNGLYLLSYFDFMAKVVPLEKRGEYFGRRNSLSQVSQAAAGGLAGMIVGRFSYLGGSDYRTPAGYALCFFLAFAVHMIDLWLLSKLKEVPAAVSGTKSSILAKFQAVPRLLGADRNFAKYAALRALMQLGFQTGPFFIVFASSRVAMTGANLGVFTAVNLLSWATGTFFWGQFADRFGFKRIMELCTGLIALIYCVSPVLWSFPAFVVFFAANGFVSGGQALSFDALLMEFGQPANRPSYIATLTIVGTFTGVLGPILAGFIADQFSYITLFVVVAAVMLTAALLSHRMVTDPRKVKEYWA